MSPPQSYASSNLVDASHDSWSGHLWPPRLADMTNIESISDTEEVLDDISKHSGSAIQILH